MADSRHKKRYPLAEVETETPLFPGHTEAVMMDSQVVGLIGNWTQPADKGAALLPVYKVVHEAETEVSSDFSTSTTAAVGTNGQAANAVFCAETGRKPAEKDEKSSHLSRLAEKKVPHSSGKWGRVEFHFEKGILHQHYAANGSSFKVVVPEQH